MPKILKPYTIIPRELYVQRDADRQVKNIISDMGRPGYVLVSRQMGKTNLLLNAKRIFENENDIFVYIDLSNAFPNARGCFENIIDIALETFSEKFRNVSSIILERRSELKDTPPHRQHTNELRLLLNELNGGKMIIILDEIDALTKTDYSDQIFSQIRSTYFASRVNYKEFYNLTYLLSGVVEPNEIIKDPKISPFNIGQKIYLNDFSKNEFKEFLNKAKLNLSEEIADRIFYWTNGNPRITWDVCSEVENQIKEFPISIEDIDKIITDLYLTTFNKPPIDNIREIVKNDRDIRNSIVEIDYKKGKEVSDNIKSKLYLAGIINYDENDIHIKNEIIKQSLNSDWIKSLEEEDRGLFNIAIEQYENGKYPEALANFERYLEHADFSQENKDICYFYMGYSIYLEGNYQKALEYYNKASFDVEDSPKFHFNHELLKGLAYRASKLYEESKKCYEYVIKNSKKDDNFLTATVDLGYLIINNYVQDDVEVAIELFEGIVSDKYDISSKVKIDTLNSYKCNCFYNLATIAKDKQDYEKSKDYINRGLLITTNQHKAPFLLLLSNVTENKADRILILKELIDFLTTNKIEPTEFSAENLIPIEEVQMRDVLLKLFENDKNLFVEIVNEKISLFNNNKSKGEFIFDIALNSINNAKRSQGIDLLNYIYLDSTKRDLELDNVTYYNALKVLSYVTDNPGFQEKRIEYASLFDKERLAPVDYIDTEIFANIIIENINKQKYEEALHYAKIINSVKEFVPDSIFANYLVISHFELASYSVLKNASKIIEKAKEVISLVNDERIVKHHTTNLLNEEAYRFIKQNAESILNPPIPSMINNPQKSYGRNEVVKVRYKDGIVLETKYKKVEGDIQANLCVILT